MGNVHPPFGHAEHLFSELFPELRVDALVDPDGVKDKADGQQRVHLVICLRDLDNNVFRNQNYCFKTTGTCISETCTENILLDFLIKVLFQPTLYSKFID